MLAHANMGLKEAKDAVEDGSVFEIVIDRCAELRSELERYGYSLFENGSDRANLYAAHAGIFMDYFTVMRQDDKFEITVKFSVDTENNSHEIAMLQVQGILEAVIAKRQ